MIGRPLTSMLLLLTAVLPSWAQSQLPSPVSGDFSSPTFAGETVKTNYITARFQASAQVDDNALNDNRNKVTDVISTFQPDFTWNLARAHWQWTVEYSPGLSYSQEIPNYRNYSNALNTTFQLQPTKRLNLRLRNSFTRTSDPFLRSEQPTTVPTFGVLDRPNPSLLGLPLQYTSEQVGVDATYAVGPHTTAGVSGNYSMVMYDGILSTSSFSRDTNGVGARAFVSQKLTPMQSVGVAYSYQMVDSGAFGRTLVHGIMLFHSLQLKNNISFSVYAGPQHIDIHPGPALPAYTLKPGWSWTAGGSVSWSGARTGLTASVAHRVSDGGALGGGAVRLTDVSGGVTRKLGKRWNADLNVGYSINSSDSGILSNDASFFSGGLGISRELLRNLAIDVRYWYSHQTGSQAALGNAVLADHNRVSVGVSYSFSHSLGR